VTYLDPAISDDETAVAEAILAAISDRVAGWQPSEGHVETAEAEAVGVAVATAVVELKTQAAAAFAAFGELILGIQRIAAATATTTTTITLTTDQAVIGLFIAGGTQLVANKSDGSPVALATRTDISIPAGTTTLAGVDVDAVESGADSNGAAGPATVQLAGVLSASLDAPTAAGRDAETDAEYVDRLTLRTPRLHLLPITPADYAELARDVPGIGRCLARNRYDPSNPTADSAGHLTLVPLQADGTLTTADMKAAVATYLGAAERPLSVVLHIIDPVILPVNVAISIHLAQTGVDDFGQPTLVDPDQTISTAQSAIEMKFDPATWDADAAAPGGWSQTPALTVSAFDAVSAIDTLSGIAHIGTAVLTGGSPYIALTGGSAGVVLPSAGTIVVTIATAIP
jgi:Baseplate J-like protein